MFEGWELPVGSSVIGFQCDTIENFGNPSMFLEVTSKRSPLNILLLGWRVTCRWKESREEGVEREVHVPSESGGRVGRVDLCVRRISVRGVEE